jgi:dipicolinate synthase subunit A
LTRSLIALGAHITVAARNPIQRAAAYTVGAVPLPIENLMDIAESLDIVISTAPAPIVTASLIDRLPPHALVVDVTAPPGSCDLQHATATGRKAVWARALGRRAPITVGASQWQGISRIIEEILAEDPRLVG